MSNPTKTMCVSNYRLMVVFILLLLLFPYLFPGRISPLGFDGVGWIAGLLTF